MKLWQRINRLEICCQLCLGYLTSSLLLARTPVCIHWPNQLGATFFFLNYTVRLKGLLATFVASDAVLTTLEGRKNIEDCVQIVAWYHMYYYYTF